VLASEDKLPAAVRALPKGSDLMVTFATGSVATMALNWVRTTQAAGVSALLIGALDQSMMDACDQNQLPCILIEGGAVTTETRTIAAVETVERTARTVAANALDASHAAMMGDAPACDGCGSITVRNGTCYRCLNCGNSMGCS